MRVLPIFDSPCMCLLGVEHKLGDTSLASQLWDK